MSDKRRELLRNGERRLSFLPVRSAADALGRINNFIRTEIVGVRLNIKKKYIFLLVTDVYFFNSEARSVCNSNSRVHDPALVIKYIGHTARGYGRSGHVTAAAAARNRYRRPLVFRRQSLRRGRRI